MRLKGKKVIVTGASRVIGKTITLFLATEESSWIPGQTTSFRA